MTLRRIGRSLARRGVWVVAITALLVALTLSACGRGATSGTVQAPTPTLPPVEQVVQTDTSLDAIVAAIDSASIDANLDESAKDNITVP